MRNKITAARRLWLPLILCAALLGVLTLNAAAATAAQLRPDMTIIIDGAEQTFYNAQGQEVHPILCGGTTYLPVRAIGEVMGKNVDWNQTKKTVTLSGTRTTPATAGTPDAAAKVKNISVDIRTDFIIVVDGTTQVFKDAAGKRVYPMLYNGSTYLPLRAVGGLMGKTVAWDGATQTVTLTTPNGGGDLVTDADSFSGGTSKPGGTGLITLEEAKAVALKHAKLTADQVIFVKQKLEREDGLQVYDIEFYTSDYKEYDYEIDAATGLILEVDYDADSFTPPDPSVTGTISQDKAREIALAQVPGATAKNMTKLTLDRDDGRLIYEIEIKYNGMEYDFEINAADGVILDMDMDKDD